MPLVSSLIWLASCPALAQTDRGHVRLIMLNPQGSATSDLPRLRKLYAAIEKRAASARSRVETLTKIQLAALKKAAARRGMTLRQARHGPSRLRKLYAAIRKRAADASGRALTLTRTEVWSVPRGKVEAVKKAAARRGVIMVQLSETWNHVFHAVRADLRMNNKQKSIMDRANASKAAMSVGVMATPLAPMVEYALTKDAEPGGATTITVKLSDQTVLTITRTSVTTKAGKCIWRGTVDGTGAPATIIWWPGGKMAGTIQHEGRIYSIRHMGGELHAVVEMAEARMPREHAPMPERLRANDPSLRDDPLIHQGDASILRPVTAGMRPTPVEGRKAKVRLALAALAAKASPAKTKSAKSAVRPGDVVIDVIVAYTRKAASNYADVRRELAELSIEEANESFRISGVGNIKLRLVHSYQTDYMEEGAHFDHVWRFADKGDGYMEEIHGLRDKYRADVAVLIVDDPQGCGLATRVFADADEAFAVVHHECAATSYTVAHEIGHLIGARHDLGMDKVMNPFPYGHGYVNGTKWRDIMSYKESCGGCPRIPVWSSPKVLINGEPAGTLELDNARVIAEQAARVAAFR
jgi:hypothetical protein